jgi:uncharacterized protein YlxW (UPF0749 family)
VAPLIVKADLKHLIDKLSIQGAKLIPLGMDRRVYFKIITLNAES